VRSRERRPPNRNASDEVTGDSARAGRPAFGR
jgi:hypothetical protein